MSNFNLSPNMGLPIPVVGVDPGPDYGLNIDSCLTITDLHGHIPGQGVPIVPAAMNISSDLTFQGNNATFLRSTRYSAQGSPLNLAADVGCLYVSGIDLYYNDISGNQIRITQGGSVAGSTGTITGLPSGTASAAYNAGTFIFQRATNTPANIDGASYILRNNSVGSKGLTLSPPNAMAADYGIVLPSLPAIKGIVTLNSSGNMAVEPTPPAAATSFVTVDSSGNLGTQVLLYQIIVGVGGTHSTIGSAIAAAATDSVIIILSGTYTENVVVNKRLFIQGQGYGTQINGTVTFSAGSSDAVMKDLRILDNVNINSGASEVSLIGFWLAAGKTITNNGAGSFIQGMQE